MPERAQRVPLRRKLEGIVKPDRYTQEAALDVSRLARLGLCVFHRSHPLSNVVTIERDPMPHDENAKTVLITATVRCSLCSLAGVDDNTATKTRRLSTPSTPPGAAQRQTFEWDVEDLLSWAATERNARLWQAQ